MRTKRVRDPYAPPKAKSPEQALESLMALCARSEKSSGDARRLMSRWGVASAEQEAVLRRLIEDRFIDDERYTTAFIREKCNLNGWGRYKLVRELQQKGIKRETIEERMAEMEETNKEQMSSRLKELIDKRLRITKYTTKQQLRDKLIRYGASQGYDFTTVNDVVREAISNIKEEEDEACYDF